MCVILYMNVLPRASVILEKIDLQYVLILILMESIQSHYQTIVHPICIRNDMYCSNAVGLILLCGLVVIWSISPPNLLIEEYHSLAAFDNNS